MAVHQPTRSARTSSARATAHPVSGPGHERTGGPSAETRRKVLEAVGSLLERLDYRSVTIDAAARAAGVGKSTIYRHWPSREALVLEAYTDKTNASTPVPDTGDAVDDLRTYVAKLAFCLTVGREASVVTGLIIDAIKDPQFAALYRQVLLRERRQAFVTILTRGQQRGQIRADLDLDAAVDAVYGAVHHRLLVSGQVIDGPFVTALLDVVTRGLLAPAPTAALPPG